jgi:hypothetical protein
MAEVQQWARVRARTTGSLRRGAWYRVLKLSPSEALLEVHGRPIAVLRPFLQILPVRPLMWSVVLKPRAARTPPGLGASYAVCPRCSTRAPLRGAASSMGCVRCAAVFPIAWNDSHWRVFEAAAGRAVRAGRSERKALAKARDAALRLRLGGAP